jgi:predicted RecB family nuclease
MLITDNLLLNYKRCNRRTYLEVYGNSQQKDPEKDFLLKLKKENHLHILDVIQERSLVVTKPKASIRNWQQCARETIDLMERGVDCIGRGVLSLTLKQWQALTGLTTSLTQSSDRSIERAIFVATPILLLKQPGKSRFGNWQYVPINIKLGRRPKPEYKLIAAFHAQMLAAIQGTLPSYSRLILKSHNYYDVNLNYWLINMQNIVAECLQMLVERYQPEVFISRQRCSLCHWYSYCYDVAKRERHLSLIPGITPKRYQQLKEMGIANLATLATTSATELNNAIGNDVGSQLKQQVDAILQRRAIVKSNYDLTAKNLIPTADIELYFDIEAEPERGIDYLLGIVVVDRTHQTETFQAFLAERPEDEEKIWQEFVKFVSLYPAAPIFHYSEYEAETIARLARLYSTPDNFTQALLFRLVDIHQRVIDSVVLPVESYSLKSLGNWIGFYWRDETASGDLCVCWYDRWLSTGDRLWLEAILDYNEDDCRATFYLKNWLVEFLASENMK